MLKLAGCSFMGVNMSYNKPPLTYAEQLDLLESRGLVVSDRSFALHKAQSFPVTTRMGFPEKWENLPIWSNHARQKIRPVQE